MCDCTDLQSLPKLVHEFVPHLSHMGLITAAPPPVSSTPPVPSYLDSDAWRDWHTNVLMPLAVPNHGFQHRENIVVAHPDSDPVSQGTPLNYEHLVANAFQCHRGDFVQGTLLVEPCYLTSIFSVLVGSDGIPIQLRIASLSNHDLSLYQKGTEVFIMNPFFVRFLDGSLGLRIADPRDIRHASHPRTSPPPNEPVRACSSSENVPSPDPYVTDQTVAYPVLQQFSEAPWGCSEDVPSYLHVCDQPVAHPEPVENNELYIGGMLAWRSHQRVAASTDRKCNVCHDRYGEFPSTHGVSYVCSMECMTRFWAPRTKNLTKATRRGKRGRNLVHVVMYFVLSIHLRDGRVAPKDDIFTSILGSYYQYLMDQTDRSLQKLLSVREFVKACVSRIAIHFDGGSSVDVEELFASTPFCADVLRNFSEPAGYFEVSLWDYGFPWLRLSDVPGITLENRRKYLTVIPVREGTLMFNLFATAITHNVADFNPERTDHTSMRGHKTMCQELEQQLQKHLQDPPPIFQDSDRFPGMYQLGPVGAAFFDVYPDHHLLFIRNFRMPYVRTVLREWQHHVSAHRREPDPAPLVRPFLAVGCWRYISSVTHSCAPNCCYFVDFPTSELKVRASKDIRAGECLSIPCFDIFRPLAERRRMWSEMSWSEVCVCARCVFEEKVLRACPIYRQLSRTYSYVLTRRFQATGPQPLTMTFMGEYSDDLVPASYELEKLLNGELRLLGEVEKAWLRSSFLYSYLAACHHWVSDVFQRGETEFFFPIGEVLGTMLLTDAGSELALSVIAQCLWGDFFGATFDVRQRNKTVCPLQEILDTGSQICERRYGKGRNSGFYRNILELYYDELPSI